MRDSSPDTFTSVLQILIHPYTLTSIPIPLHPSDRCSSIQLSSCSSCDAVLLRRSPARKTQGKLGRVDTPSQAILLSTQRRLNYTLKAIWARFLVLLCTRSTIAIGCIPEFGGLVGRVKEGGDLKQGRGVCLLEKLLVSQVELATTSVQVPTDAAFV